jgi:hypothetical protein
MNERIKQLAEQATTRIEPTANSGEGWIFDKEKFAELIVRECVNNIKVWEKDSRNHISHMLKNYFGVEG